MVGLWFGLGLALCWLMYFIVTGLTPLDLWQVTQEKHGELVAERDYLTWLILHPYDTLLFIGWPLVGLFALSLWQTRRSGRTPADVLAWGMLITLIAVNVVGIVQGENGRILSFYAPFILLSTTGVLTRLPRGWSFPLLAAQALLFGVMACVLAVVPQDLNPSPHEPRQDMARLDDLPLSPLGTAFQAAGRGRAVLSDYRLIADVGLQTITLETVWLGDVRFERPFAFEVVATAFNDIDGNIITPPQRWYAQNSHYPPTCWDSGDVIVDTHILDLPVISAPVVWDLTLRLVDVRTGEIVAQSAQIEGIRYP
jgi:hypothetical protein